MARIPSLGVGEPQAGEPAATGPPVALLGAAAWKPWTVALAFTGAVGLALAGRAIVTTGSGDGASALLGVGLALIVLGIATVAMALVLANAHVRPTAADFGLRRPQLGRAIGLLLAVWIGFTVATVLWLSLIHI